MYQGETLSQQALNAEPSMTMAITAQAKDLSAAGEDVCSFAAGEPDFPTPAHICQAAAKAALDKRNHSYPPNPGYPEVRAAAAKWLGAGIGVAYQGNNILISPGAKFSLYLAMQALLEPGDEALLPAPYWVSYPAMISFTGAKTVIVPTAAADNFRLSAAMLAEKITPRTKLVVLNSPANPSGAVLLPADVKEIGALLEQHNLLCLSDEIYDKLIFTDTGHHSVAAANDYCQAHTVVVNGCSKAYAMPGWRLGVAAGAPEIIKAMAAHQSQSTSSCAAVSQQAALAAFTGPQDCVVAMRQAFAKRRDLIVKLLNEIAGFSCHAPGGAFYVFVDISGVLGKKLSSGQIAKTPLEFCQIALAEALCACVPGEPFGSAQHIRLSYAVSDEAIVKGCQRLAKLVDG